MVQRLLWLFLLALVFCTPQQSAEAQKHDLLRRATRIASVGKLWDSDVTWLNDQEVLTFASARSIPGEWPIVRHNVVTGREQAVRQFHPMADRGFPLPKVSPDARRILWSGDMRAADSHGDPIYEDHVTDIAGKHRHDLPTGGGLMWRGDSRHWLALQWDEGKRQESPHFIAVGDIFRPHHYRRFTISRRSPLCHTSCELGVTLCATLW